ncbi:MAG: hypothetical protein A2Y33_03675 [Spirochaetes bacterium GWF1_51_8]|nr:MAG: hypothetical protein A2Y33_03675 [Spirochaetes bacterium GWF1_51_8]
MPKPPDFIIRPETTSIKPPVTHDGPDIPRTAGVPYVTPDSKPAEKPPLPGIPSIRPDTIVPPEPPPPMPGVPVIDPNPPKP